MDAEVVQVKTERVYSNRLVVEGTGERMEDESGLEGRLTKSVQRSSNVR